MRWLIVIAGALALLFWLLAPRAAVTQLPDVEGMAPGADAAATFGARESQFDDLVEGTARRIVWAGEEGAPTDWVVVYLHGFSASSEEIRPVPAHVAEALGANRLYARFTGHGRDSAAMAEATADAWLEDTVRTLAAAEAVGERILVISTSTGGTLAATIEAHAPLAPRVAGHVMISPNFMPTRRGAMTLTWPGAIWWAPLILGQTRSFVPENPDHARFWTESYPTRSLLPVMASVDYLRGLDLSRARAPALVIYSEADEVVRPEATRTRMQSWGGPVTFWEVAPGPGIDPSMHVLAGDILSPAMTGPVTARILDWARDL